MNVNLLVDIGNSRLKSAVCAQGADNVQPFTPFAWRDSTRPTPDIIDEFDSVLDELWSGIVPSRIIVCNVAGESMLERLSVWCTNHRWPPIEECASEKQFRGLLNGYANPAQLGTDRWVAMIGARACYTGALCVIDSGTATTVDLVSAEGRHLGGAIFPGVNTMRKALDKYTAGLFDATGDVHPFSDATVAGIAGGTGYAAAGAIDRFIDEARLRLPELTVVFTGGEASLVAPLLRNQVTVNESLVLQGLTAYAN